MARIVFDLDGTLIDSAPDIQGVANRILNDLGVAPLGLDETHAFIGNGAAVFVDRMCRARGIPKGQHAEILAQFLAVYDTAVTLTHPYPHVVTALENLSAAGHRLGLCTNKPIRPARAVLAHLGLDGFFDTVIGGDSLNTKKPDPAPLLACFETLVSSGAGADTPMLYVGDSEVDAETADRAGIPFLLFTGGYHKGPLDQMSQTGRFDSFDTLPGLIARCLS